VTTLRAGDRITIEDVAREADVSYATVSRVINSKGYVSEETRQRVMAAVTQTGYVVNRQARGLAGGRSQIVGLVVPGLDTSYIGEVVRGIDDELVAASYDLMLYTGHQSKRRESAFVATVASGLVDGLLLVLPAAPETYLESFMVRGFPYVLIDHGGGFEEGPSIGATNRQGAIDATNYLIELGHRRIGFVTGIMNMGCTIDRLDGYREALKIQGIQENPSLVVEGNFQQRRGYECARELLALDNPPSAIFASNDESALGVMEAVRDAGFRIGDDISVIGFDDIPAASNVHPRLTTVRQPLEEMGRRATQMLLELINDPEIVAERIDLPTELVIRESCRSPALP
jgi:LacI family transcriptional regulator